MAYRAVRLYGMFGEKAGYMSTMPDETSEKHNASIDMEVKEILDVRKEKNIGVLGFISKSDCTS